jgi:hypothetical protein
MQSLVAKLDNQKGKTRSPRHSVLLANETYDSSPSRLKLFTMLMSSLLTRMHHILLTGMVIPGIPRV